MATNNIGWPALGFHDAVAKYPYIWWATLVKVQVFVPRHMLRVKGTETGSSWTCFRITETA